MFFAQPANNDVICGGSRIVRCHPGNQRFQRMINDCLTEYEASSKKQRSSIISKIVDDIRSNSENGGFIQKDTTSKKYFIVPDHRAVSFSFK
jgi:hypothetical protein